MKLEKYGLKITAVRCFKVPNRSEDGLVAIMELEFNDNLVLGSVRLLRGEDGELYFRFPSNPHSKRNRAFSYVKDEEARQEILGEMVREYETSCESRN